MSRLKLVAETDNKKALDDIQSDLRLLVRKNTENELNRQQVDQFGGIISRDEFFQFINHEKAFGHLTRLIEEYVQKNITDHIELRLMAVAMCYSLSYISNTFIPMIKKYKDVNFKLKIVVSNYDHLSKLHLDSTYYDWIAESKVLLNKINKITNDYNSSGYNNLYVEVSVFNEVPQRHGMLLKLNEYHLFQGVSDWDMVTKSGYPRLTVGSNLYRYYDESREEGRYWISVFRHWFSFYQKYQELLINEK